MTADALDPLAEIAPVPRGPRWMAPPTPYVAVRRTRLLFILGRFDLASRVLEEQIALLPRDRMLSQVRPVSLLHAGRIHMRRQEWSEAERALRTLVEFDPGHLEGWNNLGVLFVRTGRREEARAAWEQALEIDPENTAVRENLRRLSAVSASAER